jgi:uncharacterized protein (DUF697 family)
MVMGKRNDAFWTIVQHSVVNGGLASVPTPGVETGKHMMYSANEIAMCLRIAHIYIGPQIKEGDVKEMLVANGLAAGTGAGLAIVATKVGQTVVDEMLNFVPVVGWMIKGSLAGSITASLGWAFLKICEETDS